MIVKLENVIFCSSEHPDYPASNLLIYPPSNRGWRCATPGLNLANVIFKLREPTVINGMDIANYRSCIVTITGSTNENPDNWIPIITHEFMSNDDAVNCKFRDQFMIFTKTELKSNLDKIKFSRINVTCMQTANPRELFGLNQLVLKTELVIENNVDLRILLRPKTKPTEDNKMSDFKKKYFQLFPEREKIRTETMAALKKAAHDKVVARIRAEEEERAKRSETNDQPMNLEEVSSLSDLSDSNFEMKLTGVCRTPFGDLIPDPSEKNKKQSEDENKRKEEEEQEREKEKQREREKEKLKEKQVSKENKVDSPRVKSPHRLKTPKKCVECMKNSSDSPNNNICLSCHRLSAASKVPTPVKKPKVQNKKPPKPFGKLLDNVSFAMSGYVNPQRDEIRRKALKMGARYVADPDNKSNKCSHLVCAFKKTPKFQQLHGTGTKIVTHAFIEECFDHKKRFPWRRYALTDSDQEKEESEEEIESSFLKPDKNNVYNLDTDSD